jgi:hypothetical protein
MPTLPRLAAAAVTSMLALPAGAMAASTHTGVVLSAGHHSLQVVDAGHVVHAYGYRGTLPHLRPGSRISFAQSRNAVSHVRVTGVSHTVSYLASVVRSSGGHVVLRLADGRTVRFSSKQVAGRHRGRGHKVRAAFARAGGLTITIQGLQPGATVLITETVAADGAVTITITLQPGAGNGSGSAGGGAGNGSEAGGVVTDVQDDNFTIQTDSGSSMTFQMDAADLADVGMTPCDTVDVTYHQSGGALVADNVDDNGTSDQGACAGDGSDGGGDSQDAVGTIVSVSAGAISLDTPDQGRIDFTVDPTTGLTDGFLAGDVVDVSYSQNADGSYDVSDIEYVENDSVGVVTAVTPVTVTITDSINGTSETFIADPTENMFSGVTPGDAIDVTWHQAAAGLMAADNVDDLSADGGG